MSIQIEELLYRITADAKELDKVIRNSETGIDRFGRRTRNSFSGINRELGGMLKSFFSLKGAVVGLVGASALGGLVVTLDKSIERLRTLQTMNLSTAATLTTFTATTNPARTFEMALDVAGQVQDRLREIDRRSFASMRELNLVNQALLQQNLTVTDSMDLVGALTNSIKIFTAGQPFERQAFSEIRALFGDGQRTGAALLRVLEAQDSQIREHVKLWREENTLVENLLPLMRGLTSAEDAFGVSIEGAKSTLSTAWDGFLQKADRAFGISEKVAAALKASADAIEGAGDVVEKVFNGQNLTDDNIARMAKEMFGFTVQTEVTYPKKTRMTDPNASVDLTGQPVWTYNQEDLRDARRMVTAALELDETLKKAAVSGGSLAGETERIRQETTQLKEEVFQLEQRNSGARQAIVMQSQRETEQLQEEIDQAQNSLKALEGAIEKKKGDRDQIIRESTSRMMEGMSNDPAVNAMFLANIGNRMANATQQINDTLLEQEEKKTALKAKLIEMERKLAELREENARRLGDLDEKEAKEEEDKLRRAQAVVDSYKRRLEITEKTTATDRLLYDMAQGKYDALGPAQWEELYNIAQAIDLRKLKLEQEEEEKRLVKELAELRSFSMTQEERMQERIIEAKDKALELLEKKKISYEEYREILNKLQIKLDELQDKGEETGKIFSDMGKHMGQELESTLAMFLFDPFQDGLDEMVLGFFDAMRQMLAQATAMAALRGLLGGTTLGNWLDIKKLAGGGPVFGPGTSTSDSIPARLSKGEFVEPANAVEYYGIPFMESIRKREFPRIRPFTSTPTPAVHFAEGGLARAGDSSQNIRLILLDDRQSIPEFMASSEGDRTFVLSAQRNSGALGKVLRL